MTVRKIRAKLVLQLRAEGLSGRALAPAFLLRRGSIDMNIDEIRRLTGIASNEVKIDQAMAVVETFIGRLEFEISGRYLEWFERMVSWQVAYMTENDIFTTANVESIRQDDSTVKFNKDFGISPLVVTATRHLSWKMAIGQVQMSPWISHRPLPEWYTW